MTNSGSITSIPTRIVQVSAIQPIERQDEQAGDRPTARRSRSPSPGPGPGWRATAWRGCRGRASPASAEMTQLRATATTMFGARAKPTDSTDVARHDRGRGTASSPATSPAKRRVTMRAPYTRPTSWNGSAIAAATPRARSSSPNSCSYSSDASTTKPTSDDGEERQRPPDPAQRRHLVDDAPALGERRRRLLGVDDLVARPGGVALPPAADRLVQAQGEDGEDRPSGSTNTRNGTRQPNE